MNSKEIVQRTIDYANPDRVARSFQESDFVNTGNQVETYATDWKKIGENKWERIDTWGNVWGRIDPTSKGEVKKGVLTDIDEIDSYGFPDFSDFNDYSPAQKTAEKNKDKWVIAGLPGFTFNISRKLFKLDKYLTFLLLHPEKIKKLHDKVDKTLEDMIRNYGRAGVDSIMFPEDWGTQTQTLISPDLWREEFYPRFKKLCKIASDCGLKVFMHSCGKITDIIPDLMKAGIDLLQFDQPTLHGINTLASFQREAKITFWCPVDIQKTLQTEDGKKIKNEARQLLDKLWQGRGGFVAGYYNDNQSIGLDPKWQEIACEEFIKYGKKEFYQE